MVPLVWEEDMNSSIVGKQKQVFSRSLIPHEQHCEGNGTVRHPSAQQGGRQIRWEGLFAAPEERYHLQAVLWSLKRELEGVDIQARTHWRV